MALYKTLRLQDETDTYEVDVYTNAHNLYFMSYENQYYRSYADLKADLVKRGITIINEEHPHDRH